jgi:hypothetical protein
MTAGHTQVVQATSHFHDQVGEALLEMTERLLNNATAFDTGNDMLDFNPETRDDMIEKDILG